MFTHLTENYEACVAVILFAIGMCMLLFDRNLLKKVIGLDIMDTGTFLLLALTRLAHMDVCTASGNVKLINLSSNVAALFTFLFSGQVLFAPGLAGAAFCLAGHYIGSGLVMKNGTKIVRPIIIIVLILLFIKVISGN